jgi:hypothetical protein
MEKRVEDAQRLLQALRDDPSKNFAPIITGDENWFSYNYESLAMFSRR